MELYAYSGGTVRDSHPIPLSIPADWYAPRGHKNIFCCAPLPALPDAEAGETLTGSVGGVLDAAVGVEDEAGQRLAAPDGHAEGGESEICVCLLYTSRCV